mmetsp:Transcript_66689/g.164356  ORF Transcript_66689/g.164356 Transcript_66689/m.164356 type:complete len:266 (+) Transcript_66689:1653-2450(+)
MPCSRSALSSMVTSRMVGLLHTGAQPVVAGRVRQRRCARLQAGGCALRRCRTAQPRQHVGHMLQAHSARGAGPLQGQLHGHEYSLQAGARHQSQHLRHRTVAAGLAQQYTTQALQRLGKVLEGSTVPQRARLPLHQRDVVLPVIAGLALVAQPLVPGHDAVVGDDHHLARVQPRADHLPDPLAGHGVAVAGHAHQAGAAHARHALDVAVEGLGHRQQVGALVLQHLGHAEGAVLGVAQFTPQRPATLGQPGVELGEAAEALAGCV